MKRRVPKGYKPIGLQGLEELMAGPECQSILDMDDVELLLSTTPFGVRLDEDAIEYLDEVATAESISKATVLRLALYEFMDRHPLR